MNAKKEMDTMQLCRTCKSYINDDAPAYPLIKNSQVTELGKKCVSLVGEYIELMKDGYPKCVCKKCQLEINTSHLFIRKAKMVSIQFEKMLQESKQEEHIETDERITNQEVLSSTDMVFEMAPDEEINEKSLDPPIEVEFIINKTEVELVEDEDDDIPNGDEEEYTIEYLEPEYMATFEDEITQNEEDEQSDNEEMESKKSQNLAKKSKRTYPYKCTKCNKRFVYKEVYEAHIRIHKGLPGFSCPHCPKTFNEKANFDYHMQDHTNYRPAKCDLCEKSFKNKQDLASHIRCHKDIRKYMCDVCGKRFRSQSHMTYHRYAHFEARNFACDLCTQKFKSPHILRTHRNTVHSTVYRYECEQCKRKFKRDHHLVAHRRTHNKTPGNRKPRKKKVDKTEATFEEVEPSEVIEMIKDEELDINYEDEVYEEELITD